MIRLSVYALLLLAVCGIAAADSSDTPQVTRYVSCPIYRDTDAGRKSGCWLSNDPSSGVMYDVTIARSKPLLGQQILVEGVPTNKDGGLCGGVVLDPVSVSVLPKRCKDFLIPAEGHAGRRFVLPERTMQPTSVPRKVPPPPYVSREFLITFELNSDFLDYQYSELILEDATMYAKASKPHRVLITGYAATRGVEVSGVRLREDMRIAEARARMVAEAFERLGVPRSLLTVAWKEEPRSATPATDGLTEAAKRRVTIQIEH